MTSRYLRIAPRKVRAVADLIRGKTFAEAERELSFSARRAAKPLIQVLKSARANLGKGYAAESLVVREIRVDAGPSTKRWMPRAMSRTSPIAKRSSHITVVLAATKEAALPALSQPSSAEVLRPSPKDTRSERKGVSWREERDKVAPRRQASLRRFFRRKAV